MANTPVPVGDLTKALSGPGILLEGVLGSADPSNTVAGGIFTDDWSVATGWSALGPTDTGSQFHDAITTDEITYAESYYPLSIVTTARSASIDFALINITATNLKKALNGATTTTSGAGATLLTTLTPPTLGSEVRRMIGWESNDHTVRLVGYQALQVGSIEPEFRKGATKATLPCTFRFEQAATGYAYRAFFAGAARG